MDTAERTSAGPSTYDGFISYSHAADDLLAPRLQAGLQKFAKPWWKRRAVRIFRDESSLAANPHLWSSITEALEDSGWFVLLLSPDAAQSEWVGKEIEHWIANKPADRILPVVTDGDFTWENGDVAGSSVPAALHGVFGEEPRWVDLRFAKGDENLDLQNPDFSAAVADVASAIRGVPKDELASEEVRQHRRTVRTAWAAGTAVTVLAVAAVGFGLQSARNADEARANANQATENERIAEENARQAQENADRADQEANRANENAEQAQVNADLAKARELAASGINVLDEDPELALQLTLAAIDVAPFESSPPVEVVDALWQAASANRLVDIYDPGTGPFASFSLSPDRRRMALMSVAGPLSLIDLDTGDSLWTYSEDTVDTWMEIQFSPDGSMVSLMIVDSNAPTALREAQTPDNRPNRLVVIDSLTGADVHTAEYANCGPAETAAWSPDSRYLAITSGATPSEGLCARPESPSGVWAEIFETESWKTVAVIDVPLEFPFDTTTPAFDSEGTLYLLGIVSPPLAFSAETFDFAHRIEGAEGARAVSPDGTLFLGYDYFTNDGPTLWSAETGEVVDRLSGAEAAPQLPRGLSFSNSGDLVSAMTGGAFSYVWDLATGDQTHVFRAGDGDRTMVDESLRLLYTSHGDGLVRTWNLGPARFSRTDVGRLGPSAAIDGNSFAIGDTYGAAEVIDFDNGIESTVLFDLQTGALVGESLPGNTPFHLGGDIFGYYPTDGPPVSFDPTTGVESPLLSCIGDETCDDVAAAASERGIVVSADGGEVATRIGDGAVAIAVDVSTGARSELPRTFGPSSNFFGFGAGWVLVRDAGSYVIVDRSTGAEIFVSESTLVREYELTSTALAVTETNSLRVFDTETWENQLLPVDFGLVRALAFSSGDRAIAVGDEDRLRVIDLTANELTWSLPIPQVSDVHWIDEQTLLVGTLDGLWTRIRLDVESIVDAARSVVRNGFTSQECLTYRIDPCPSLEELTGG